MSGPIPVELDLPAMLTDLNGLGWRDYKIEIVCGFANGYIAQLRCGDIKAMSYQRGARLYNFWADEVSRRTSQNRTLSATT